MTYCDFCSVIGIIRQYISEGSNPTQPELIYDLFYSFAEKNDDFDFDNGQINRWIKGASPVSPKIAEFYQRRNSAENLSSDIENGILPLLYDTDMAAQELYNLVLNDLSISEQKRTELTADYDKDNASFFASVIIFAINRKFVKHDLKLLTSGALSPVASDMIFNGDIPKPCKHFCGRDTELDELHSLLSEHSKIFVRGVAGIGKSEFAKAYAEKYKKEYSNILYFTYSGSIQKMISEIDFADDKLDDDEQTLFRKHNRFLQSLKSDSLIIVDNFNTTASEETMLDILMKYGCKVIFTTKSRFECGHTFELNEISDIDTLVNLSSKFYSEAESNRDIIVKIIEAVHSHTFAVELSARLLQKGISEPDEVLKKLTESNVNPKASDKIEISKDGETHKAVYYSHIRTLFSLYLLDEEKQSTMRCMTFVPLEGIRGKLFAGWLNLSNMDCINDLVELGFIQNNEANKVSLLPIVRDIAIEDLKPSVESCETFLNSIHQTCQWHGEDISYRKLFFTVIENIIHTAIKDNLPSYICFIEDAFSYMSKYLYENGMKLIVSEMERYREELSPNDLALLYDCRSSVEIVFGGNISKAIDLAKKAVETCIPEENIHLAANLNMNLGYCYHLNKNLVSARPYMEKAIGYMKEYNIRNNDCIIMAHNYANLLSDCGEQMKALKQMKYCTELIKTYNTDKCSDYADLYFDMGIIYLQLQDKASARSAFDKALTAYRAILSEEEIIEKFRCIQGYIPTMKNTELSV